MVQSALVSLACYVFVSLHDAMFVSFQDNTVIEEDFSSDSDDQMSPVRSVENLNYLKLLLMFLTMWQFAFKVSNSAITALLRFMRYFILLIGRAFSSDAINDIGHSIPLTLSTVHKLISLEKDHFTNFVVCPKCDSVYEIQDCVYFDSSGQQKPKDCSHVDFPNHPQASMRNPCGGKLLKQVRRKHGNCLVPIKVYPFMSLKESFRMLVKREGFLDMCEKWRQRTPPQGFLCDIYEGKVWQMFTSGCFSDFLSAPHCFLLSLNVDWFEPFERGVYSVGAIYLTLQNLPRHER